MLKTIRKLFHDWLTGPGNDNFELGRFLWGFGAIGMLILSGVHLHLNGVFDVASFGLAYGGLLAAGGFGISQKDKGASAARGKDSDTAAAN